MKKLIIFLCLLVFLVGRPVYAVSLQEQYRQALMQVIVLLLKQVEILQRQLSEKLLQESVQRVAQQAAVGSPAIIVEIKTQPEIKLPEEEKRIFELSLFPRGYDPKDVEDKEIEIRQIHDLDFILYGKGDLEGISCSKTNSWGGVWKNPFYWERVEKAELKSMKSGYYGAYCINDLNQTWEDKIYVTVTP